MTIEIKNKSKDILERIESLPDKHWNWILGLWFVNMVFAIPVLGFRIPLGYEVLWEVLFSIFLITAIPLFSIILTCLVVAWRKHEY